MENKEIKIPLEYAKSILKVLENMASMGHEFLSSEIKEIVSKEAYHKMFEIYCKYHNANYGPFNRHLKKLIDNAERSVSQAKGEGGKNE